MEKAEALQRLIAERDYEDDLARNQCFNVLYWVHSLDDLSKLEKDRIREKISKIMDDSIRHLIAFENLIFKVEDSGKNQF